MSCHNQGVNDGIGWTVSHGLEHLLQADELIGHNIIKFDIPALQKVYPWFAPRARLLDTLVLSRLIWPEIADTDEKLVKRGKLPRNLRGRYSLEAFGCRLGQWKGDYGAIKKAEGQAKGLKGAELTAFVWGHWSQAMQDYCEQDVEVNASLFAKCWEKWKDLATPEPSRIPYSDRSVHLEMDVAGIIARQERWGFAFNEEAAQRFYVVLVGAREKLERELKATFGSWWASAGQITVSKTRRVSRKDHPPLSFKTKKDGSQEPVWVKEEFEEGSVYTKLKRVEFNAGSRQHISGRLTALRGWKPSEFTPSGEPKVDETVLSQLPWPEAALIAQYLMIQKRIGQLAEGNQAWLKKVRKGRIHGGVVTNGAVTRRMTHQNPNVAQVPKCGSPYGEECRALFTSSAGWVLVGCDADSLELRCLGGYMARYDDGAYIETILKGDKALGTDMHSVNARALGLDPKKLYPVDGKETNGREIAKTWFYAFIYGAGDWKLGTVLGIRGSDAKIKAAGKTSRTNFLKNLPALGKLVEQVKKRAAKRGFIIGLDGGKLSVRHAHAALNTLLQSAGAIIMKVALVILDGDLKAAGLVPGEHYEFCANIHDEWQIDTHPDHVETVKRLAEDSIRKAGEALEFKCPLAGNADAGSNWAATH